MRVHSREDNGRRVILPCIRLARPQVTEVLKQRLRSALKKSSRAVFRFASTCMPRMHLLSSCCPPAATRLPLAGLTACPVRAHVRLAPCILQPVAPFRERRHRPQWLPLAQRVSPGSSCSPDLSPPPTLSLLRSASSYLAASWLVGRRFSFLLPISPVQALRDFRAHLSDSECEILFRACDTDGDGSLDRAEFVAAITVGRGTGRRHGVGRSGDDAAAHIRSITRASAALPPLVALLVPPHPHPHPHSSRL